MARMPILAPGAYLNESPGIDWNRGLPQIRSARHASAEIPEY